MSARHMDSSLAKHLQVLEALLRAHAALNEALQVFTETEEAEAAKHSKSTFPPPARARVPTLSDSLAHPEMEPGTGARLRFPKKDALLPDRFEAYIRRVVARTRTAAERRRVADIVHESVARGLIPPEVGDDLLRRNI